MSARRGEGAGAASPDSAVRSDAGDPSGAVEASRPSCRQAAAGDAGGREARSFAPGDGLAGLDRDRLAEYAVLCSKNLFAIDGTWFQSIEAERGMDEAMHHDENAWRRYTASEARRLKAFLGLPERAGLEGLTQALPLKLTSLCNDTELRREGDELVFRVVSCRVQTARGRKGMPYHPCKPVGLAEYGGFARAIDDRIECVCESCYPEETDGTCSCSWRFRMADDAL